MTEQEKLELLSSDFRKLDENWKDYILELSQKLVDIHCGGFSVRNDLLHEEFRELSSLSRI